MTIFAAMSFVSFVTLPVLAALVWVRNPKSPVNRICTLMLGLYAIVTFIEFGYRHSVTEEQARFWWSVDVVWPAAITSLFYFALFFSKRHSWLKRAWVHAAILLPMITATLLEIFTEQLTGPPVHNSWGWTFSPADTALSVLFNGWLILLLVGGLFLTVSYAFQSEDRRIRKQAGLVSTVWMLGVATTIYETFVVPGLNIDLPPQGQGLNWLFGGFITAYVMWRYDAFALSPITAAENIVAAMADSLLLINNDLKVESANEAAKYMLEYDDNELCGMDAFALFDATSEMPSWLKNTEDDSPSPLRYIDARFRTKNGRKIPIWLAGSPLHDADGYKIGYMMIGRDITERNRREQELKVFKNHLEKLVEKRTEQLASSLEELKRESSEREKVERERETLEVEKTELREQLYHAQKLESIGRLAGGVAHDFNNLLFVINTYSEGFLQNLDKEDPQYADIKEIYQAASRATQLTQQLLAFSRKQIATPKIVDPNESIHQIQKMLSRLIGEHIHVNIIPGINIGRVKIDPGQLDQILMNLAVNARDAMPKGGSIQLETNTAYVSSAQIQDMEDVHPGPYVMIRFADTGHGMDEDTKSRIFDPFFSTKKAGQGTGLGLSTIYGIVKQNGGFIEVDTKVEEGTTFRIYLPKHDVIQETAIADNLINDPAGTETILLVEDDDQVRKLACRLLTQMGYRVIEAAGAGEATRIFYEYRNAIDLLFTDVVMPGMNGKQLSRLLNATKPKLKVFFMSGYNEEITDRLGNLDVNTDYIAKPFSPGALSRKIRQVLDR